MRFTELVKGFVRGVRERWADPTGAMRRRIEITDDEIWYFRRTLTAQDDLSWAVRWDQIESILAFKRVLYTDDSICLLLLSSEYQYEVSEDDRGWDLLIELLPVRLPGCEAFGDWFWAVASPAFETCPRWIYGNPEPSGDDDLK